MNEANGIWIPAEVWSLDLPVLHRVFLARLLSLSKQQGASWAGDDFLAESLRCTPQNVRKMRRQLEESGHIVTEGYGHNRRLSVELAPVVAKVAPVGTSNQRRKQPQLQELQPEAQKLQPQLRQEATTVAYSIEENRTSKEVVKNKDDESFSEFETVQEPEAAPSNLARGAARAAVVSNKAQPFDVQEVIDYFLELEDTPEEAANFYDYWTSAGWRRKAGPIKDWKATARTWIRSPYRKPKPKTVIDTARAVMEDFLNNPR